MKANFEDFRFVEILIDTQKNIAIFPISKSNYPTTGPMGEEDDFGYFAAFPPLSIAYPYSKEQLSQALEKGIELWNQNPCFEDGQGLKNTYEEVYYNIKGFKNATKGIRFISLGWNSVEGKYVDLLLPLKRGYAYWGIDETHLSEDADWIDFADVVLKYISADLESFPEFISNKKKFNL